MPTNYSFKIIEKVSARESSENVRFALLSDPLTHITRSLDLICEPTVTKIPYERSYRVAASINVSSLIPKQHRHYQHSY